MKGMMKMNVKSQEKVIKKMEDLAQRKDGWYNTMSRKCKAIDKQVIMLTTLIGQFLLFVDIIEAFSDKSIDLIYRTDVANIKFSISKSHILITADKFNFSEEELIMYHKHYVKKLNYVDKSNINNMTYIINFLNAVLITYLDLNEETIHTINPEFAFTDAIQKIIDNKECYGKKRTQICERK